MDEKKQVEVYIEVKKLLALLNALAELIRFNREQGYPKIANWYKDVFDDVLPVAEKLAGCNLRYEGVNA